MSFWRKVWGTEPPPPRCAPRLSYWRAGILGRWNWHLQSGGNFEVLCGSTQGYGSAKECLEGIEVARRAFADAVPVLREQITASALPDDYDGTDRRHP